MREVLEMGVYLLRLKRNGRVMGFKCNIQYVLGGDILSLCVEGCNMDNE